MENLSLSKDKIRFLLLEGIHAEADDVLSRAGYSAVERRPHALDGNDLRSALADVHFLGIRSRTRITSDALDSAPKLNAIGCFCIGTNQVDLEAARKRGIAVFNAPFSNTRSVAELVLAEIIMLMRRVPERSAAAHRGQWLKSASGSHEIRGKTLGIVGYGHIGAQLSVLAENLGMRVMFYDIAEKLPLGNATRAHSLDEVAGACDVLTLHVPETPQTQWMIGAAQLATMKPGAMLINASRGQVVEIDALADALRSGHLAGAAIDVFPSEPSSNDETFLSPLRGLSNVILTPHIGGSTFEAQVNIAREVASKLVRYSDNGSSLSSVNFPEVALPDQDGRNRILHVHHNHPGVLEQINHVFSTRSVNISAQYLQTRGDVGYVVMDLDRRPDPELMDELAAIDGALRARILY